MEFIFHVLLNLSTRWRCSVSITLQWSESLGMPHVARRLGEPQLSFWKVVCGWGIKHKTVVGQSPHKGSSTRYDRFTRFGSSNLSRGSICSVCCIRLIKIVAGTHCSWVQASSAVLSDGTSMIKQDSFLNWYLFHYLVEEKNLLKLMKVKVQVVPLSRHHFVIINMF
jgi:hypothetical protein